MLEKFPKLEVPMGLDANAKLAGHTNGFSVGDAVPNSDMMAGNEERTTFFLNFMTKNGLVAQNSWTATAASQEDMYTRREWDEHEILGNLAVGTQAQRKGCRYEATKPTAFFRSDRPYLRPFRSGMFQQQAASSLISSPTWMVRFITNRGKRQCNSGASETTITSRRRKGNRRPRFPRRGQLGWTSTRPQRRRQQRLVQASRGTARRF